MPRILVITRNETELEPIRKVLEGFGTIQITSTWGDVVRILAQRRPPEHLFVPAREATEASFESARTLYKRGYLVPTTVWTGSAHGEEVMWVGAFQSLGRLVAVAQSSDDVEQALRESRIDLALFISELVEAPPGFPRSMILYCERVSDEEPDPIGWVARELGLSRSALYRSAREAGLFKPAVFVTFFRYYRSARVLHCGASAEDAAYEVAAAGPTSLRRSLKRHFGLTIRDIRNLETPDEIAIAWIQYQEMRRRELVDQKGGSETF